MFITAHIELLSPLLWSADQFVNPVTFTLFDGIQSITNLTATQATFEFNTDATGAIVGWAMGVSNFKTGNPSYGNISSTNPPILTTPGPSDGANFSIVGVGTNDTNNINNPGHWTVAVGVPEPPTILLLAIAPAFVVMRLSKMRKRGRQA